MNKGELERAKRHALHRFDEWLEVTGAITKGCSWHGELESIIEDAVDIGARMALGIDFMEVGSEEWNAANR